MFGGDGTRVRAALLASVAELYRGYGRFMQPDPIGYADGLNWYAYVGGDPVNATDPSGTILCVAEEVCVRGRRHEPAGFNSSGGTAGAFNSGPSERGDSGGDCTECEVVVNGVRPPKTKVTAGLRAWPSNDPRSCIQRYRAFHDAKAAEFMAYYRGLGYRVTANVSFIAQDSQGRDFTAVADWVAVPPGTDSLIEVHELKTGDARFSKNQGVVYGSVNAIPVGANAARAGLDLLSSYNLANLTIVHGVPGCPR